MKNLLTGLLLAVSAPSWACDACAGVSGNQSLGILPQYSNHFVGLQGQIRRFSSVHPALTDAKPDTRTEETYRTLQLWGKYNVTDKLKLFGFVPYNANMQQQQGSAQTTNAGLGDISLIANWVVLKSADTSSYPRHRLQAGGGVKLPTGKFVKSTGSTDLPMMQLGTASWDALLNANYTVRGERTGLLWDATYTLTTPNSLSYKYGNRLLTNMLGFRTWQVGQATMILQAGGQYELALHDYDNFSEKWLNEQTGGSMLFGTAGLQAIYGRLGLQCSYQSPLWQKYANGHVKVKYKADAGLFFMM
ncbi:MAG: hypothetical protein EOP56_14620 [Sphingobacteriales bacterium]|nr:MAG: hypothetical protein EOP56_14620 [Sphingobacteriales bacterium]